MEWVIEIFKTYGVSGAGWIFTAALAYHLFRKLINNQERTTDNLTELTGIVKVQQEQIKHLNESKTEMGNDIKELQAAVFIVRYESRDR